MVSLNILATALLCSTEFAVYARTVISLELKVTPDVGGWVKVKGRGSFKAKVLCDTSSSTLEVASLENSESRFKNPEALLAIWEEATNTDAANVRHIQYDFIQHKTTTNVLNDIWKSAGINPKDKYIPSRTVYRPSEGMDWDWSSLRSTRHGSDVIDFCTDYEVTNSLQINSFDFGKSVLEGRWLRINVAPWQPQIDY
ncbi:hypothetical protein BROUX41_006159 [Berkeleyomyces rouxiae]|uniref:uncharacterized protein n=1 Tax=Berkeleyomyces rouxiae TaxID=2035830 RepID=UPI003B77CE29